MGLLGSTASGGKPSASGDFFWESCVIRLDKLPVLCYIIYMIYDKRDWTITFNDGSTASYYQMTALEALNISANDWWGLKHPVAWAPLERVSVWDLEYWDSVSRARLWREKSWKNRLTSGLFCVILYQWWTIWNIGLFEPTTTAPRSVAIACIATWARRRLSVQLWQIIQIASSMEHGPTS